MVSLEVAPRLAINESSLWVLVEGPLEAHP